MSTEKDNERINLIKNQICFSEMCEGILIQSKYPDSLRILFHVWVAGFEGKPFDLSSLAAVVNLPNETVRRRVKSLEKDGLVIIRSENQKRHTVVITEKFLDRARPIIDKGFKTLAFS